MAEFGIAIPSARVGGKSATATGKSLSVVALRKGSGESTYSTNCAAIPDGAPALYKNRYRASGYAPLVAFSMLGGTGLPDSPFSGIARTPSA